jgi:hypothetical protein
MMNDVTLKQIAAVKAIVSKGNHIWIIGPHLALLLGSAPLEICAYPPMASV